MKSTPIRRLIEDDLKAANLLRPDNVLTCSIVAAFPDRLDAIGPRDREALRLIAARVTEILDADKVEEVSSNGV